METLFTERDAIEIAFRNLEGDKQARRDELREDLKKIDERQYFIMERLQELDAQNTELVNVAMMMNHINEIEKKVQKQIEGITAEPIPTEKTKSAADLNFQTTDAAVEPEPVTQTKPEPLPKSATVRETILKPKTKPKPTPVKRGQPQMPSISAKEGATLLVNILKAADGPLNAKEIAAAVQKRNGRAYTNPHGTIKTWAEATDGKVKKIGTKYSIDKDVIAGG